MTTEKLKLISMQLYNKLIFDIVVLYLMNILVAK